MKELLRSTDPTVMAFAEALLEGEGIECFALDVNMSLLHGGIGALPQRMMVRAADYDRAVQIVEDNGLDRGQ